MTHVEDVPRVRLVSTLLSHQLPSLSAVSVSDVLWFTISRSFDGLDILIAVLTVLRTSAIVLGYQVSLMTFMVKCDFPVWSIIVMVEHPHWCRFDWKRPFLN